MKVPCFLFHCRWLPTGLVVLVNNSDKVIDVCPQYSYLSIVIIDRIHFGLIFGIHLFYETGNRTASPGQIKYSS